MKNISISTFSTILLIIFVSINPAYAMNDKQAEMNKQNVIDFYNAVVNEKDFNAATQYFGPRYTQHNPTATDGPEGLKIFIQFLRDKYPQSKNEIKHIYIDGDYIILHVHSVRESGTLGRAIIDVFKLENNKIIEHWDVIQDIPEISANQNGMF
jgi:predicted SnoaL-like aldol condensation-catalyzing enzyme